MVKTKTLSNGIRIVYESMEYLQSISLGAWVHVGSADESKQNNGISHVAEHMLFQGTKTKSAKDIARINTLLGGSLNAFTSKECTSYYIRTLSENLETAIELLADMLMNSIIDPDLLEKEKNVIMEEIDMYEDSPEDMVHEILQEKVWDGHPLGYIISGTKSNVSSLSQCQLEEFMKKYYVGRNLVISIAGNFQEQKLLSLLDKYFHCLPEGIKKESCSVPEYKQVQYIERKDIEQAHICFALPCVSADSPKRYAFYIMNEILGGSGTSRLFQKIREEKGLAYSIYSYGSLYKQTGLFQVYAAMNPRQCDAVCEEILSVMQEFKKSSISKQDFEDAKAETRTEMILNMESTEYRMESNAKELFVRDTICSADERLQRLEQVTLEETMQAVQQYLSIEKISKAVISREY